MDVTLVARFMAASIWFGKPRHLQPFHSCVLYVRNVYASLATLNNTDGHQVQVSSLDKVLFSQVRISSCTGNDHQSDASYISDYLYVRSHF
jgi:hypothetical protein